MEIRGGYQEEVTNRQRPETGMPGLGAGRQSGDVLCSSPGAPHLQLAPGPHDPLTIRFTMMILGPSVLLMVKMCIRRRQNMMKSRERMMRPGYSSAGMSLAPRQNQGPLSSLRPEPVPSCLLTCPRVALGAPGPQSTKNRV